MVSWVTSCLLRHVQHRSRRIRRHLCSCKEISGSCGDLGTFIPLYVALSRQSVIHPVPALFGAGLANVVTGWTWDIPMCVQPMKTIATLALLDGLTRVQVTTAGIWMGLFLFVLGITNGIEFVNRWIPTSVIYGLQMGVGLSLALHGILEIMALPLVSYTRDCQLLAIISALVAFYLLRTDETQESNTTNTTHEESSSCWKLGRKPPVGILLFGVGAIGSVIAIVRDNTIKQESSSWGFDWIPVLQWSLTDVSVRDWRVGLLEGALPQLPLSILNSVISVCCLAQNLYPDRRSLPTMNETDDDMGEGSTANASSSSSEEVLSRREVCLSVGIMNLILCPLGGMPCCHGAGGLAGQHKFGARHGASVVFLGLCKIALALIFGGSIVTFCDHIPASILGVMLALAGQALTLTGLMSLVSDETDRNTRATVALVTTLLILGTKKTHYGALGGLAAHVVYARQCRCNDGMTSTSTAYAPVQLQEIEGDQTQDMVDTEMTAATTNGVLTNGHDKF